MKNAFFVIVVLLTGVFVVFREASAGAPQAAQQYYALPTQAERASLAPQGTSTPDYMATKIGLENQSAALQITMAVDAATATAGAVATAAQDRRDQEMRDEQIKLDSANRQREKEALELETLRNRLEWERWFVPFWEWLKYIAAVLLALLAYTGIRYMIPVMAARLTPPQVVEMPAQSRQPARFQETEERQPLRFMLTKNEGRTYERGEFPEDLIEPMLGLARHVVEKRGGFSEDELVGHDKIFKSRNSSYLKLLGFLVEHDLLEEIKHSDGSVKYYYVTRDMRQYLAQYLAQYRQETGDLD